MPSAGPEPSGQLVALAGQTRYHCLSPATASWRRIKRLAVLAADWIGRNGCSPWKALISERTQSLRLFVPHNHADEDMHPAIVAFLDIIHFPLLPATAFAFVVGDGPNRLFHIHDTDSALLRHGRALVQTDLEMRVVYVINGVIGLGWNVFVIVAVEGFCRCAATGCQDHKDCTQ